MVARSGAFLLALGAAIALSGCELAIYSYGKAVDDSCAPWAAGCAAVVDAAGDGPVQAPRRSVAERAAIVEAAEAAPVRQCTRVPLACQGATLADVIVDQYVAMF
jgi:hypothetical protein